MPATWQSTMEWPTWENCIFDLFKKDIKNASLTHQLFASFTCCVQSSQANWSQLEFSCICKAGADNQPNNSSFLPVPLSHPGETISHWAVARACWFRRAQFPWAVCAQLAEGPLSKHATVSAVCVLFTHLFSRALPRGSTRLYHQLTLVNSSA